MIGVSPGNKVISAPIKVHRRHDSPLYTRCGQRRPRLCLGVAVDSNSVAVIEPSAM